MPTSTPSTISPTPGENAQRRNKETAISNDLRALVGTTNVLVPQGRTPHDPATDIGSEDRPHAEQPE